MENKYYTVKDLAKIISYLEDKKSEFRERSARQLLEGYTPANKKKLEKGDPEYLGRKKPHYYSEDVILEVLNTRKQGDPFSSEDLSSTINLLEIIEKENKNIETQEKILDIYNELETLEFMEIKLKEEGDKEGVRKLREKIENIQRENNIYLEPNSYKSPYEVDKSKIITKVKSVKLEVILEKILEEMGYMFEEDKFYEDLILLEESYFSFDYDDKLPIDILEKKYKVMNPKKYYIKKK